MSRVAKGISVAVSALFVIAASVYSLYVTEAPNRFIAAAARGDVATVNRLLSDGMHPDTVPVDGHPTALYYAAERGHGVVVEVLLNHGANPNKVGSGGEHPLMIASSHGDVEIVGLLIKHGVDIEYSEERNGFNALHEAIRSGRTDIVTLLVRAGADVNARTMDGVSPIARAEAMGRQEMLPLLRKAGAQ